MIHVCDAITGAGKSSAAITYMNEHRDKKFIYITPYLDEARRIKVACPKLNFVEPNNINEEYHHRKREHTAALIKSGKNISTTHQAFRFYTPEMLLDIKKQGYILFVDENINILEKYECSLEDMEIAKAQGYVIEDNDTYYPTGKEYHGVFFRPLFNFMKEHKLMKLKTDKENGSKETLFYWILSPELLLAFSDVYILTYMFSGQGLHHLLEMYNMPYEYIGVHKDVNGTFRYGEFPGYIPEYVGNIKNMIHILDNDKYNKIGNKPTALSKSWYMNNPDEVEQLKKNIYNCIRNVWREAPATEKLWTCFNDFRDEMKGKGYTKSFLVFNARATNKYRDRKYLIYAVNLYMNVGEKLFYEKHGVTVDEDAYALSILIQWIWRSAIRDGEEIYLYIPSKRMRTLLENWMNDLTAKYAHKNISSAQDSTKID